MIKENPIQDPFEYPLSNEQLRKSESFDNNFREVIFKRIAEGKLPPAEEVKDKKTGKVTGYEVKDFAGKIVYFEADATHWSEIAEQNKDVKNKLRAEMIGREKKEFEDEPTESKINM